MGDGNIAELREQFAQGCKELPLDAFDAIDAIEFRSNPRSEMVAGAAPANGDAIVRGPLGVVE